MRKKLPIVFAVVLLAAAAFLFIRVGGGADAAAGLELYGNVDIRQVELGFRIPGRIAEMSVDEGEQVAAGALLARLDPRVQQDAVRAASADVAARSAAVARLEAGNRPAEISQRRAAVTEQRSAVENARQIFERREKLLRSGAISRASFDEASNQLQSAEARLVSARRALQLATEGARSEDIDMAQAQLEGARANLAAAETALADTELVAPSDGVILSRVQEKGAIVSPADTVFVLSLTRPVWVRAYVPEIHLGRVHPGLEVAVTTDTEPGRVYRGRVGFISPVAEFTPKSVETPELRTALVYRFRVIVEEPGEALRQGMPVTIRLPAGSPEDAR